MEYKWRNKQEQWIVNNLSGEISNNNEAIEKLSPKNIFYFKNVSTMSCEVETRFSMSKSLLCDNRRSFTFENL